MRVRKVQGNSITRISATSVLQKCMPARTDAPCAHAFHSCHKRRAGGIECAVVASPELWSLCNAPRILRLSRTLRALVTPPLKP